MANKNVLITGAAGNLGMAVTRKFLKEGWKVYALGESGQKDQENRLRGIEEGQPEILFGDLMDAYSSAKTVRKIWQDYGKIDAAVLLVGGFSMNTIHSTTSEQLEKMMRLNVFTAYNVLQPLYQLMADNGGGHFTLVGARPALVPTDGKGAVAYALSKGVLFQLADIINADTSESNISAHVVVPSIIDTPQNRKAMPEADFSKWVKPETIADTIYFAQSKADEGLCGSVYKVYGRV
jgi:NAD(P)-dependent dehydrogenase (short-subunit alcohol dehydrogenase family)